MLTSGQRQAAIDWLNGKQDFAEGLDILKKSGFKPGVVRRLERIGESDTAMMHLKENIYQYLRFIGEEVEDTDADLGVLEGKQPEVLKQEEGMNLTIDEMAAGLEHGEMEAPENARKAIILYAQCYREREKAHRLMGEVPETNEEENVEKRRALSDSIDGLTSKMEKIYPLVEKYIDTETEVTDEELAEAIAEPATEKKDESDKDEGQDSDDYDTMTKEELQKRLKSAKTKILRKTNLLEYQQKTKAEVANPLPECPKRVKYEAEIARLKEEVERLQYAIARKG